MERFVIVCGTNRNDSLSSTVSAIYQEILTRLGQSSEIIDLQQLPNDFAFTALYEFAGKNADFNPYRKIMAGADKFVFIVPEYNGSFPGVLKAFIDGLQYPHTFRDKKSALVGISSGIQGGGLALSHLTDILNYCGTHVLALKPRLAYIENHLKEGEIVNSLYLELLEEQARKLIDF